MKIVEFKELQIPGVCVLKYERFSDKRGYFSETFRDSDLLSLSPNITIFHNGLVGSGKIMRIRPKPQH